MDVTELQARVDALQEVSDDDLDAALGELVDELDAGGLEDVGGDREAVEAQMADLRREVEEDKQAEKDHQAFLDKLNEQAREAGGKPI